MMRVVPAREEDRSVRVRTPSGRADDLLDRTCLVTGATSGIGRAIADGLALRRAHVVVAARDLERGRRVAEEIGDEAANPRVEAVEVDVASRASVRRFAEDFRKRFTKLHVVVNNAGCVSMQKRKTAEGVELTWATNVLGVFQVTRLLEDMLASSAPARVVNVASVELGGLDLDDVQFDRRRYGGRLAYRQSKQAVLMLTWAFARRLRARRVTVNAVHPGLVRTPLVRGGIAGAAWRIICAFGRTPERGAETPVWLASSSALGEDTAGFYFDKKELRGRFRDEEQEDALVALCERMTQ
jgi:NAD(P)-dependent dehydrogenase (short-subunit alcohol dehydrogenase family)